MFAWIRASAARPTWACWWVTPPRPERLGWEPRITFEELVRQMVDADLAALTAEHKV